MNSIPLALPIIPIVAWGVGLLIGGLGIAAARGAFDDPKKNKLGVLGMQGSGKTRFLSFLRNIPFIEGETSRKKYESFRYTLSNGKEISIDSGIDIGGGDFYRNEYDKILDKNDVILYFFDIGKYLRNDKTIDDVGYQRACNSRFEHVYSKVNKTDKPVFIIASHTDKSGLSKQEMVKQFTSLIDNKKYKTIFKNMEFINLTNENEITKLRDELFKKK